MGREILFVTWFFLPVAYANMAPVFAAKLPLLRNWNTPIDGGREFRGKRLLGSHKTWRGIISGIVAATVVLWIEQWCVTRFGWAQTLTSQVDYAALPLFILGPLFGIGALGGDAIESFFKRQRGIPAGQKWMPFDQLDYIVGSVLATLPYVRLTAREYLWLFLFGFGGHLLVSYIGWRVHLKDTPI